jgi:acylphosphatase
VTDRDDGAGRLGRLEATVRGRVQGVGFRYFVVRRALELDLVGWVANAPDGSVQLVAEGPVDALDLLEAGVRAGPVGAVVEAVDAVRMTGTGRFDRFAIRSGGHPGD